MGKCYLTKNACFKKGVGNIPKGFMLHSTGVENKTLRRYLAPDDGVIGPNKYNNDWNREKPDGMFKCVHGFIGEDKNGTVRFYMTLPYEITGWHCGGSGNYMGYVGVEICEGSKEDRKYFNKAYSKAVRTCVNFLKKYKLPCNKTTVISHKEGYRKGIASNHGDPESYFKHFGKTMNMFRDDVNKQLLKVTKT